MLIRPNRFHFPRFELNRRNGLLIITDRMVIATGNYARWWV